jgi:Fic family protein
VPEAAAAARAAVDKLLTSRVLRRQSAEVSVEAGLRSARASAALEGVEISLDELRTVGSPNPVIQGALRVSVELGGLRDTFIRAPRQVLARLHVLAAADLTSPEHLGRPREGSDAAMVARRVGALAEILAQPTKAPAAVVAAIAHGELLTLRPFAEANGLVARGAARLVLLARGLDPKALTSPDVGHLELRGEYESAAAGYAGAGTEGLARWVAHCCHAIELGAVDSLAICAALARG